MPNNWTRKMPSGWRPGYCAICDIPCVQEEYGRQSCPFDGAEQEARRLLREEQAQKPVKIEMRGNNAGKMFKAFSEFMTACSNGKVIQFHGNNFVACDLDSWIKINEAQKPPTDMAGMVVILKSFVEKYDGEGGFDWIYCDYTNGFEMLAKEILSRYARPTSGQEGKDASSEEGKGTAPAGLVDELMEELVSTAAKEAEPQGESDVINLGHIRPAIERVLSRYARPSTDKCGELVKRLREMADGLILDSRQDDGTPVRGVIGQDIHDILDEWEGK